MQPQNLNQPLRRMQSKSRWFVVGAVVVMILILALIAIRQDYFRKSTSLYFFAPNAQGLNKGMAVKFIGFKIGSVENVSMLPNASVQVKLSLSNDYIHLIGVDAKAKLMKEGLVGESVVEIIPGSPQVRQIEQNGVIAFERGRDVSDIAESLTGQLTPILEDVKQITATINNPGGDVAQILKNVNSLSASLRETSQQLNALLQNGNEKLDGVYGKIDGSVGRLNQALDQANAGLASTTKTLQEVNRAVPKLIDRADSMMENIQGAAQDMKKIANESSEQIPPLVRSTNALVQDSQEILNGAKQSWPIRNMMPEPVEHVLPLDGYVPVAPGAVK